MTTRHLGAIIAASAMLFGAATVAQAQPDKPGEFDYYALVLSWSPTYCAALEPGRTDPQCDARGRPYDFVLHGLWPQHERGWPESCPTADRGFVPRAVANRMLDIMPSDRLVFHEYRRHGTCSGLSVDAYFELSRKLFRSVRIPSSFQTVVGDRTFVAPAELERQFIAANPGMKADQIAVVCGGPGDRLKEVRVCFDKQGLLRSCGENENQARLCRAGRMYVPPVRTAEVTRTSR